jgi:hypothetical protein
LVGAFDCVFDGGTIEHIFNVPVALDNAIRMLAVGGLFLSVNGANNFLGHGLYQFSPELMWRVFDRQFGFEVEAMYLVPTLGLPAPRAVADPAVLGHRDEIRETAGSTYLMVAARKLEAVLRRVWPQQSDYVTTWQHASITGQGEGAAGSG